MSESYTVELEYASQSYVTGNPPSSTAFNVKVSGVEPSLIKSKLDAGVVTNLGPICGPKEILSHSDESHK